MAESLFTKILVPVDFSPCSEEAFRVALTLAKTFQAELLLVHVIDTSALATFNQLGLLAVPSDAKGQKRRLRHHARLNVRRLLESESTKEGANLLLAEFLGIFMGFSAMCWSVWLSGCAWARGV